MDIKEIGDRIQAEIATVMIGCDDVAKKLLVALLAGGHVLLEDKPGTGKTTLAKTMAAAMNVTQKRVQFTPDLMPSDITGMNIYNRKDDEFHLMKGPVFTNILLADEINRATPRTQSSLLEAMEEKQVTIDGETYHLDAPFLVIATENPLETAGTYPLPEAQLDRFMMKLSMQELDEKAELAVIGRFMGEHPLQAVKTCCDAKQIMDMQERVKQVKLHTCIREYIVQIVLATRQNKVATQGVSTRASLALVRAAQGLAALNGRDFVIPDDVQQMAVAVLAHRLGLYGSNALKRGEQLVREIVASVPVPVEDWNS